MSLRGRTCFLPEAISCFVGDCLPFHGTPRHKEQERGSQRHEISEENL
jgi:hypothetical protein